MNVAAWPSVHTRAPDDATRAALAAVAAAFTPVQVTKALAAIAADRVARLPSGAYLVVSSDGLRVYRTTTAGGCNCRAAVHGRRCYHVAAGRLLDAGGEV